VPNVSSGLLTVLAQDTPPAAGGQSLMLVVGTAVLALVALLTLWPIVGHSVTAAHEGGHALIGSLVGGTVKSVTLNRDNSGLTAVAGPGGLGIVLVALAGYLGPSLFGLLGALLLTQGQSTAVLWLSVAFLVILLFQVVNLFGFLVVIATGAAMVMVMRTDSAAVQTVFAYTWIWFLLFGGFRDVLGLRRLRQKAKRKGGRDESSDAFGLRKLTYLPAGLWMAVFWLGSLTALVFGAAMLLGLTGPAR
jgi:hypothetical protein